MELRGRSLLAGLTAAALFFAAEPLAADHPFDPGRYAFELFSEDEIAMSKYAGWLDEKAVASLLEQSWAELDTAAAKTAGMTPDQAKEAIRNAVRGDGGVSERFGERIREKAGDAPARSSAKERIKKAARHPAVWGLVVFFVVLIVLVNRKRG